MKETQETRHRQAVAQARTFLDTNGILPKEISLSLLIGKSIKVREMALLNLADVHARVFEEQK